MKKVFISFLFLPSLLNGYGQNPISLSNVRQGNPDDTLNNSNNISYSLSTGVAVMRGSHLRTGSTYFFTPSVTYNFSSRLIINAGVSMNQNNYCIPVAYITENRSLAFKQIPVANQNIFFASGDFAVSPRLFLSGSVMTSLTGANSNVSEGSIQNSFQTMSMGMTYRVTPGLTISAGMQVIHNDINIVPGSYRNY